MLCYRKGEYKLTSSFSRLSLRARFQTVEFGSVSGSLPQIGVLIFKIIAAPDLKAELTNN